MEQPKIPNSLPPPPQQPPSTTTTTTTKQKAKLPTPQELITHYEAQGMDSHEASIKVIDDLQHMLFKVITSSKGKKDKSMAETSRKLDTTNARLSVVEMKVDSKPGYVGSFAIGVASTASFRGVVAVWPHIVSALSSLWSSVKGSTNT